MAKLKIVHRQELTTSQRINNYFELLEKEIHEIYEIMYNEDLDTHNIARAYDKIKEAQWWFDVYEEQEPQDY